MRQSKVGEHSPKIGVRHIHAFLEVPCGLQAVTGPKRGRGEGEAPWDLSIYSLPAEERAATWDLGREPLGAACEVPSGLSWTHSPSSGAQETYLLPGLPPPGQRGWQHTVSA